MAKQPVSVTLSEENLLWLRGRTAATKRRSVSDLLDALVTDARLGGHGAAASATAVVGSVDISPDDPDLTGADEAIAALFAQSLGQAVLVRETSPTEGTRSGSRSGKRPKPRHD